jgi:hypothetical protein
VSPGNPQAEALMRLVDVNKGLGITGQKRDCDRALGFLVPNRGVIQFLQQNQLDATFKQTVTVFGTFGQEFRTALTLKNVYQSTNSGVTITTSKVEQTPRPK